MRVAQMVGRRDIDIVVITHCLPDRPELLDAISEIGRIGGVIAIPYSIDPSALEVLSKQYRVVCPTLQDLMTPSKLVQLIEPLVTDRPFCVLEIGGYCAEAHCALSERFGDRLIGVVEDTEAGHRRYLNVLPTTFPVFSVARSPLKRAEDALVGPSCVFSVDRLLRSRGMLLQGRRALILGYGKVGRGAAMSLRSLGCQVSVFDTSFGQRALALAEGFLIPDKRHAVESANVIVGCAGTTSMSAGDLALVKDGAILFSCSSKTVEFDVEHIGQHYWQRVIAPAITEHGAGDRRFFLIADGTPVNYLDSAVIGPVLSLVQAEILFGIQALLEASSSPTDRLHSVDDTRREAIAEVWIQEFCDRQLGGYGS